MSDWIVPIFFIIFVIFLFLVQIGIIIFVIAAIIKIFKNSKSDNMADEVSQNPAIEKKISSEFDEVYEKEITPKLQKLEDYRLNRIDKYKEYQKLFLTFLLPGALLFALGVILGKTAFCVAGFFPIAVGIFYAMKFNTIKNNFREILKEELLKPIISLFGDLELIKEKTMTLNDVKKLGLYRHSDSKSDDDIISGTYKDIPVELVESELTHTEGDGEHSSKTVTDFKGLIFKCKINKNVNCRVSAGRHAYCIDKKMEIVNLEDIQFNKKFWVYSDDQVEARYLITPSFMERINNIKEVFPSAYVEFAFNEGDFYLFINYSFETECTEYGLFEVGDIEETVLNKNNFSKVYNQLNSIFSLIDYFKFDEKTGL